MTFQAAKQVVQLNNQKPRRSSLSRIYLGVYTLKMEMATSAALVALDMFFRGMKKVLVLKLRIFFGALGALDRAYLTLNAVLID